MSSMSDARKVKGLTQVEVAALMVVSGFSSWQQTTVAKVESGDRDVKLSEAVALARLLGLTLDELARLT